MNHHIIDISSSPLSMDEKSEKSEESLKLYNNYNKDRLSKSLSPKSIKLSDPEKISKRVIDAYGIIESQTIENRKINKIEML